MIFTKRTNTAVWIEKYNRWQIKVQKDGLRKTFYSSTPGRTGQREANAKADAWLDENIINTRLNVEKTTAEYIEQLKLTTSKSHYTQYEYYINNWINPKIGRLKIEALNEQHLQSIINFAYNKGLSKKTLQNIKGCMTSWLKFCRMNKYTTLFPENLSIPKGAATKEKAILQPEDVKKLFLSDVTLRKGSEQYDIYINAYRFQVLTGMRPGEIIGLKWSDIKGKDVNLKRSINVYGEVTKGKNDNARRSFQLTDFSQQVLMDQKNMLKQNGITSNFVFPNEYGDNVAEKTYYQRWRKYRDYNKLSAKTTLYELRHTFVSITKSLPEGYLKQLVGHSKDMDTYGVYSHEISSDKDTAAKMIQDIFEGLINDQQKMK